MKFAELSKEDQKAWLEKKIPTSTYSMFSEEGDAAVREMVQEVFNRIIVRDEGRKSTLIYIKEQCEAIEKTHEEVHDTEVRECLANYIEKIFDLAGYQFDFWIDL